MRAGAESILSEGILRVVQNRASINLSTEQKEKVPEPLTLTLPPRGYLSSGQLDRDPLTGGTLDNHTLLESELEQTCSLKDAQM